MKCQHCGADVAAATSFCTRCGSSLSAAAPISQNVATVPLTDEQRMWLKVNTTLPILTLLLVMGGMLLILSCFWGGFLDSPFVKGFWALVGLLLVAVCVMVAIHVRSHRADARAGVAQVRVARLIRKWATSQSPRVLYAEFEQIGSLKLMPDVYQQVVEGTQYRVTYSPHTRRVWTAELIVAQV